MISLEPSGLTEVDGAVRLTVGNTTVVVSATGPIEPKPRQEMPTQASLEIVVRPSRGVSSTREKFIEDTLRSVLQLVIIRHKYPRQLIQIVVQFLATDVDWDGRVVFAGDDASAGGSYMLNEISAALNGCYFALVDANVALFNSFAAVSVALDRQGKIHSDPDLSVLREAASHHVVCFDLRGKRASKILLVESNGQFLEDRLVEVVEFASGECEKIHAEVQRPVVEEKIGLDFVWA